jgi:multiple sugar transport system permease protein
MADMSSAVRRPRSSGILSRQARRWLSIAAVTLLGLLVVSSFLAPLGYMALTALKDRVMVTDIAGPIWPVRPRGYTYQGQEYSVYRVPTEQGLKEWALVEKGREESGFVDPANPGAGIIQWVGRWRVLEPAYELAPYWKNFPESWNLVAFPRVFRNTFVIAIGGTIGAVLSSILVAYGFARFRIPGKSTLFMILIATIILPGQVTLIPTYTFFRAIGWGGTWWPLIIPHFFANAYNVFLLRQYFLTIPNDIDEAAMIDGASPFRTLVSVIIPQSMPAILAVCLFHFFFAWNDFFAPLVYLSGKEQLYPISIALSMFTNIYSAQQPGLAMATAMMAIVLPVVVFFMAQRQFMQGIVITGVEK